MLKFIKKILSQLLLVVLRKIMVPRLFVSSQRKPYSGENIVILHHNFTPTLYYYFISRLDLYNASKKVILINTFTQKIDDYHIFNGSTIVIIRYIPPTILFRIKDKKYANIIYFIDDNIPAAFIDATLPPIYALKTTLQFYSIRYFLSKMRVSIFFSTKNIFDYYKRYGGKIFRPRNIYTISHSPKTYSICYLGASSHTKEYNFIASIAKEIQNKTDIFYFFVIDSSYTRKLFNNIPRVYFIGVSKMPDYICFLNHSHFDIGLSPLFLDGIWNKGKSYVKIFDISISCSYGIFSKNTIYAPFESKYRNFYFLENIKSSWIKKIFDIAEEISQQKTL